jgi:hypothetical protein
MSSSSHDADLRVEPKAADRSLGELFAELSSELGSLVRTEIELAKTETKEEVSRAGKAGAMFGGAGLAAWFALLFVSFALAWLLDEVMHPALAFLIVGVVYAIAGYVLFTRAKAQAKTVEPIPQTVGSLKENLS